MVLRIYATVHPDRFAVAPKKARLNTKSMAKLNRLLEAAEGADANADGEALPSPQRIAFWGLEGAAAAGPARVSLAVPRGGAAERLRPALQSAVLSLADGLDIAVSDEERAALTPPRGSSPRRPRGGRRRGDGALSRADVLAMYEEAVDEEAGR